MSLRPIVGCVCYRCWVISQGGEDPGHPGKNVSAGGFGNVWLAFCHLAAAVAEQMGIASRFNSGLAEGKKPSQRDALIWFFVMGHELPMRPGRLRREVLPS